MHFFPIPLPDVFFYKESSLNTTVMELNMDRSSSLLTLRQEVRGLKKRFCGMMGDDGKKEGSLPWGVFVFKEMKCK